MNNKKLKDKIVKMLNDDYVVDELGATSPYIIADAVGSIAEDIVNLLPIHDVSDMFSFSAYLECYYSYWDNTELGDIYTSNTTGKEFTTNQIYCKWLKWK